MNTADPVPEGSAGPDLALSADEWRLVEALRSGDEGAFVSLIERYSTSMIKLALIYVPNRAVAEEVVQEAWLGVLRGLAHFAGRSSLKTWIFRILINCARTRGKREAHSLPFSTLANTSTTSEEAAVDPGRFRASEPWRGHWTSFPAKWEALPEEKLLAQETLAHVHQAITALPPTQRLVLTLRDVEGWSGEEVQAILQISAEYQRVLLHRARSRVRRALEQYFTEDEAA